MKLYNTLTKRLDEVEPQDPPHVTIYTCGPTVYDHIHIGNLSSFIFSDTLRRALVAAGYKVKQVMNFTDVDDKTIARSHQQYSSLDPKQALKKLTEKYSELFLKDMRLIGNGVEHIAFIKATDSIAAMQQLIRELHKQGFAYEADDGIYFSIDAYKHSGKKYGQLTAVTASSTSEARIHNDEYDKDSAHDFALWKTQKTGEPAWGFELDNRQFTGRPGWHIECSAMSHLTLGQPFDIHTGGVDLIFPHHENEIAQSTAGKKDPLYAKYFAHNEHLLIDNQKMSKSLNNFLVLSDITAKGFEPLAFRLLVLQAHYRSQAHFSWDNLAAAQNRLNELRAMAALRWQPRKVTHDSGTFALEDVPLQLTNFLSDDLNTPQALAFLSQVTTQLKTVHIEADMVDHFVTMLQHIDDLFGLDLMSIHDISDTQKAVIAEREAARANQDWKRADSLREQLIQQGIGVHDAAHGPIWYPAR